MSGEREDGLPTLVDCSRCSAKTFRPLPNVLNPLCGECWADDCCTDDVDAEHDEDPHGDEQSDKGEQW